MSNHSKPFWIGGKHAVLEAIKSKKVIVKEILLKRQNINHINDENYKKIIKINDETCFNKIFNKTNISHQGFAAKIQTAIYNLDYLKNQVKSYTSVTLLDNIFDDRNIGSIIRSAVAFGVNAVIVEEKNFRLESEMLHKASSGMINKIDVITVKNIKHAITELKKNNFWIYGLDIRAKQDLKNFKADEKYGLILGSEGQGIKKSLLEHCDTLLKITIHEDVDSLNVSNSASIAFYHLNSR